MTQLSRPKRYLSS